MLTGHIIHEQPKETSMYKCSLTYAERFLRRKRLETDCGISFVLDLEKTTNLNHGDHIELSDGSRVTVLAKPERLAALRGTNLMELAWHVGNRHTPCEVVDDQLLVQRDHVIDSRFRPDRLVLARRGPRSRSDSRNDRHSRRGLCRHSRPATGLGSWQVS